MYSRYRARRAWLRELSRVGRKCPSVASLQPMGLLGAGGRPGSEEARMRVAGYGAILGAVARNFAPALAQSSRYRLHVPPPPLHASPGVAGKCAIQPGSTRSIKLLMRRFQQLDRTAQERAPLGSNTCACDPGSALPAESARQRVESKSRTVELSRCASLAASPIASIKPTALLASLPSAMTEPHSGREGSRSRRRLPQR